MAILATPGVTKWISGWKKNGWVKTNGEAVINKEELKELDDLMVDINIKLVHVDAHCGGNEAADKLANKGARRPLDE